jgi:hypothetical protein
LPAPTPDYLALFRALHDHGVEFIVVGGVCAVLHGAPVTTFDLDVVHARTPENVDRLLKALKDLGATSRSHPGRKVVPGRSHLESGGHQLLSTVHGPLDLLGSVGLGRGFVELKPQSTEVELAPDLTIRLLGLEALIELKEEVGHEKDLATLPILRQTLRERDKPQIG